MHKFSNDISFLFIAKLKFFIYLISTSIILTLIYFLYPGTSAFIIFLFWSMVAGFTITFLWIFFFLLTSIKNILIEKKYDDIKFNFKSIIYFQILIGVTLYFYIEYSSTKKLYESNIVIQNSISKINLLKKITPTPSPTPPPKILTVTPKPTAPPPKQKPVPTLPWGQAKQLDDVTYTIKVGKDSNMALPQEIHNALNTYRNRHGSSSITWDTKLAEYASQRAKYFSQRESLDKHEGFKNFIDNDGFSKLGFNGLGENAAFGYTLEGVHLIEWVFAGDPPHNNNQLDPTWTHVGIGVDGKSVCVIFGKDKI